MRQVKGSYLLDFIKVIRANRDSKNFDKWLTKEDWEIIDSQVFPSNWYPLSIYRNAGLGIFKEIAGESVDITKVFGKLIGANLTKIYGHLLAVGDPPKTMEKYVTLRNIWFREVESHVEMMDIESNQLTIKFFIFKNDKVEPEEAFAYLLGGNLEGLVECANVGKTSVDIKKVDDGYEYIVKWGL
jgi:hypothetical protein